MKNLSRRLFLTASGTVAASVALGNFVGNAGRGQTPSSSSSKSSQAKPPWFAPSSPPYPYFKDRGTVIAEAKRISNALEAHVKGWLDGKLPAEIPNKLLPKGIETSVLKDFVLKKPGEVTPQQQWAIRPAQAINFWALRGYFPDPHCTYLVLPTFFAPFGSKVILEGEFPHCRFFDIQATPSFHPEAYHYNGAVGVGEVPIVDVDINPLPGHVNPFRVGANRNATKRKYRVTFDLGIGNPVNLNPAFRPPYYRATGNNRTAGAILYQGPWGEQRPWGHGRGMWDIGQIWIRYYAPDQKRGSLAGVPLPKVYYQLPDGRTYYINANWSAWAKRANRTVPARWTWPAEPSATVGPSVGWSKQFGIFRAIVAGIARETNLVNQKYVRDLDKGVAGRGEDLPAPGNLEPSATSCTYINYLLRGMSLGWGKIAVLTGKLPTVPSTRNGEPTIKPAQARYWSLTGYDTSQPEPDGFAGAAVHSIMDDEVVTDSQRRYVIVFSPWISRPKNATAANGVTWVDWGPTAKQSWTLRWLSVHPEWSFSLAPNEANLPWSSDWASKNYDETLIGDNTHDGFLNEYLPQVHYMTKAEFEKLGDPVNPSLVPVWR